jgi:glycosyltransferase involved in cell wall biosynthesis
MRKRLVILAKYFPPETGGMETFAYHLSEALKDDFDLHVLAHARSGAGSDEQWDGFRVRRCGTWVSVLSQPFSPSMLTELARLAPDIVQLNAPNAFANLCWSFAARGAKLVVTHHADVLGRPVVKRLYTPLYRRAVASSRAVVVLSRKNACNSADLYQVEEKLVEIPPGVDPDLWRVDDDILRDAAEFRARLAGQAPVASFVGRLIPYKGLDVLLRAVARQPAAYALVAGEGPLLESLRQAAYAAGLAERFRLLGKVDERTKRIVLLASDLFVLPSVTAAEAFGIVQVEAQLLGLPVIASDLASGVTDVTVHEETGLLVTPRDDEALAAAMSRLFNDAELRSQFSAAGRQRALERFSLAAFRNSYTALFRRIAAE